MCQRATRFERRSKCQSTKWVVRARAPYSYAANFQLLSKNQKTSHWFFPKCGSKRFMFPLDYFIYTSHTIQATYFHGLCLHLAPWSRSFKWTASSDLAILLTETPKNPTTYSCNRIHIQKAT